MNLSVKSEKEIKKKTFILKPIQKDGLVLRVHHTDFEQHIQRLRFIYTCFSQDGNLVASADNDGHIYLINFSSHKFWGLPPVSSCTVLKFSIFKNCELLIGLKKGVIFVINIEVGSVTGRLIGHKNAASDISFSSNFCCLSASPTEAIIWDLKTNSKIQVLTLQANSFLKYVAFVPTSNNILGCYTDDMINIWEFDSFHNIRIILPAVWENICIKHFAFSPDGTVGIVCGYNPRIAVYSLQSWKILKFVNLPDHVKSIKYIGFVKPPEANSVLAILSGQGIIYFYNLLENIIMSELQSKHEVIKFDHAQSTSLVGCVLSSGQIEIYNIAQYVQKPANVKAMTEVQKQRKVKLRKAAPFKIDELKGEIENVLNVDKLRAILKEFGEYPSSYRTMIWEHLLQLPNNKVMYESIMKQTTVKAFDELDKEYPMENVRNLKNLKCLLNNLGTWCKFFTHVHYMPIFVFPFVKVFHNKPLVSFEAIATIILNWCQYWFEYFPLPPINVLAIIENMLAELDGELLHYLTERRVTSKMYAWPLLECAFSEVLTSTAWFKFWDHVLTNEPSFLLCTVVAYNITLRSTIFSLKETEDFQLFYHKQNPIDLKKFFAKCYFVFDNTSKHTHPRKYLNPFVKLNVGTYQIYDNYPKAFIENQAEKMASLQKEIEEIEGDEVELLFKRQNEVEQLTSGDIENIERKRLYAMKQACNEILQMQQKKAKKRLRRLSKLRQKFGDEQAQLLTYSRSEILKRNRDTAALIQSEIETNKATNDLQAQKAEDLLIRHYSDLLNHKMQIEALLKEDTSPFDEPNLHRVVKLEQQKIASEIKKIMDSTDADQKLREYNIQTSVWAMEDLIKKVETALAKELSSQYLNITKSETNMKAMQLKEETKTLEVEVTNLLKSLADVKFARGKSKSSVSTNYPHSKSDSIPNTNEHSPASSNPSYPSTCQTQPTKTRSVNKLKKKGAKWKRKSSKSVRFESQRNKGVNTLENIA